MKNENTENILTQMDKIGINPMPFLEIAAKDLIDQYGDLAQEMAETILINFTKNDDQVAQEIWKRIIHILKSETIQTIH